jgi:putative Mn2+ efflux pump MntP
VTGGQALLLGTVGAVGVLHTIVPDHWLPLALMARQGKWSRRNIAGAAFLAGLGHTLSTLAIGLAVYWAGLAVALRFGHLLAIASSLALIGFGLWIGIAGLREAAAHDVAKPRPIRGRGVLLIVLGSSPMIEGIPAFFAAARFGAGLLAAMAALFALATIVTYVGLTLYSATTLQRISIGPLERYGEALSGAIVAIVGMVFLIKPLG